MVRHGAERLDARGYRYELIDVEKERRLYDEMIGFPASATRLRWPPATRFCRILARTSSRPFCAARHLAVAPPPLPPCSRNSSSLCGVFALTLALRSYRHPVMQSSARSGSWPRSFLTGYLLSGSRAVGALARPAGSCSRGSISSRASAGSPCRWSGACATRARPAARPFPPCSELTEEVEGAGFEHIDDAGWDWEEYEQFFRLFYKADERLQAAICLVDQQDVAFYYLSLSSRGKDGTIWTTWNYPFSYSLQLAPQWHVNRHRVDLTFPRVVRSAPAAPPPPRREPGRPRGAKRRVDPPGNPERLARPSGAQSRGRSPDPDRRRRSPLLLARPDLSLVAISTATSCGSPEHERRRFEKAVAWLCLSPI